MKRIFFAVLLTVLLMPVIAGASGASSEEKFKLKLLKGEVDTRVDSILMKPLSARSGSNFYILQFDDRVQEEWVKDLEALGVKFYSYIPENAYIVKIDPKIHSSVLFKPHVQYVGEYRPEYKTPRSLDRRVSESIRSLRTLSEAPEMALHVKIFDGEDLRPVKEELEKLGGTVEVLHDGDGLNEKILKVTLPVYNVPEVSKVPQVEWAEEFTGIGLSNNLTKPIVEADIAQSITGRPLDGSGVNLGILDTGLDTGNPSSIHPAFAGKLNNGQSKLIGGMTYRTDANKNWKDWNGHGTFVAVIMTGENWDNSGLCGVAPQSRLFVQCAQNYGDYLIFPSLQNVFTQAVNKGVSIINNSWFEYQGSTLDNVALGAYTIRCLEIDTFVWKHKFFLPVVAAGNFGVDRHSNYTVGLYSTPNAQKKPDGIVDLGSIAPPGTAKNCITVGATESTRTSGLTYGDMGKFAPMTSMPFKNSTTAKYPYSGGMNNVAAFSGRGPTADKRIKPDIVAPGTMVVSTITSLPNFEGYYNYHGTGSGGTSYAAPMVSGAAALVTQYYKTYRGINPSASLIKATLINGAVDIGALRYRPDFQPSLLPMQRPDFHQGWGRLDIMNTLYPGQPDGGMTFYPPPGVLLFKDVYGSHSLGPGKGHQGHNFVFNVNNTWLPVRVTLVWSDYPGAPEASAQLVNDINLTVIDPAGNILTTPNNFDDPNAPWYKEHWKYDPYNNVRSIEFIPPMGGDFLVEVDGYNIPKPPQSFALVVTGDLVVPTSTISGYVKDSAGNGVANYTVTATGPMNRYAVTGPDGRFDIYSVQGGNYFLNVYDPAPEIFPGEVQPSETNLKSKKKNTVYHIGQGSVTLTVQ